MQNFQYHFTRHHKIFANYFANLAIKTLFCNFFFQDDMDGSQSTTSLLTDDRMEPQNSPPPNYLSPINIPPASPLTDSTALYASWDGLGGQTSPQNHQVASNFTSGELTYKEMSLVNCLVNLETESREQVAMNSITREGIMHGLKTGASLRFDVLKEGYHTAVKRIAYFMRKIDMFQNFTLDDKRALIGK